MSYIYLIIAFLVILYYRYKHKDILQPNMLFLVVWYLAAAISSPNLTHLLNEWSFEMHFVVLFSGLSFWFGSILYVSKKSIKGLTIIRDPIMITKQYRVILISLFIICLGAASIEWINGGARISFLELNNLGGDAKAEATGSIPGVHYATLFLPFVSILAFFSLMNTKKFRKTDLFIIVSSIAASFVFHLSRGDMLIFILAFLFIFSRYHKIKKKQLIMVVGVVVVMFFTIMTLRVNKETMVFNMVDNPYYSVFYSYIAPCFANLNDLINSNIPYNWYGNATFAPLWTIIGMKESLPVTTIDQMELFNARTYLYGFYHDYKLIGILIVPFALGYVISKLYVFTRVKSSFWIILLAAMQKAILTTFFGNYFFGEMVILFPYLLLAFIIHSLEKRGKKIKLTSGI